jgi:hypothetical protein
LKLLQSHRGFGKNSESYKLTMAYLMGLMIFENGVTPFELIRVEKKNLLSKIYNIYGYMSFSFADKIAKPPNLYNSNTPLESTDFYNAGSHYTSSTTR